MTSWPKIGWIIIGFVAIQMVNAEFFVRRAFPGKRPATPYARMAVWPAHLVKDLAMFIEMSGCRGSRVFFIKTTQIAVTGKAWRLFFWVVGMARPTPPEVMSIA